MSKSGRYTFNPLTLSFEMKEESRWSGLVKSLIFFGVTLVLACVYFWVYTSVLGFDSPKIALLKKKNAELVSRVEVLNRQLDRHDERLSSLQMRDDGIYRSIFGMDPISKEVRNAGFGGVNRYLQYESVPLKDIARRIDILTKKTYVQSKSFDEVALLSRRVGDMASCIPAIRIRRYIASPALSDIEVIRFQDAGRGIQEWTLHLSQATGSMRPETVWSSRSSSNSSVMEIRSL